VSRALVVEPFDYAFELPARDRVLHFLALWLPGFQLALLALLQCLRVEHILKVVHHDDVVALALPRVLLTPLLRVAARLTHARNHFVDRLLVDAGEVVDDEDELLRDRVHQVVEDALSRLFVVQGGVALDRVLSARRVENHDLGVVQLQFLETETFSDELLARLELSVDKFVQKLGLPLVLLAHDADDDSRVYDWTVQIEYFRTLFVSYHFKTIFSQLCYIFYFEDEVVIGEFPFFNLFFEILVI